MKAAHRHELETNELADKIGTYIEQIKPYSKAILGVVILAVAGATFIGLQSKQERERIGAAWQEYYSAAESNDPKQAEKALDFVASKHAGILPGMWARQTLAEHQLASGSRQLLNDRKEGEANLDKAKENYQGVIKTARDPMLLSRAHLGLAQTLESLGELEDAQKHYEQAAKSSDTTIRDLARQRIEDLKKPETKEWYKWFAKQKPKAEPSSGDGALPHGLGSLGDRPDISFPGSDLNLKPDDKPKTEDAPKPDDKPKDEDKPRDDDKPKDDKPVEPKPADAPKPAFEPKPPPAPEAEPPATP